MKKIITINLGGRQINIEDTAYQKIQDYLNELREHFKNEPGKDEIITDIESRFSELMNDKVRKGAPNIVDADVEEIIASIGRPQDFDDAPKTEGQQQKTDFQFAAKRRLYRDANDKVLGGVCSGIANWLNIDPAIIRVLFAILSLGGFGTGILIYLFLWIFLPVKRMTGYTGKRLFRNPDDKMIGGVASGLGAYFGKSASLFRWVFAIPLILSAFRSFHFWGWDADFDIFPNIVFGSLTGTFIMIYIILWIILPEAKSYYEKMEMRGKPVDLNTIKENVQGSMGDIKDKIQNWSKEVSDSAQNLGKNTGNFASTKAKDFSQEFKYAARRNRTGFVEVIGTIFKIFILLIVGSIAISLFVSFVAILFSGFAWAPINNFLWTSESQQMLAWGTLLFFIGAPIVGLLVWVIRKMFNITTPGNYLNWTFSGLWIIGWFCLMFFISSVTNDFKREEKTETPVLIQQPTNGNMILRVSQPELDYNSNYGWINGGNDLNGFDMTEDTLKIANVGIRFEKSPDSLYHVTISKYSLGKTDQEAKDRVQKLHYTVTSQDSILDLANGFAIDNKSKFRFQKAVVTVQVPVGKKVRVESSVYEKLNNVNYNIKVANKTQTIDWNTYRDIQADEDYIMEENGNLRSLASPEKKINTTWEEDSTSYRWDSEHIDTASNSQSGIAAPQSPATPAAPTESGTYRYDASETASPIQNDVTNKTELKKQLEQKQKELDDLKKKLNN